MERCYAAAATLTADEAIARLERERVPCGVVLSPRPSSSRTRTPSPSACSSSLDHPVAGGVRRPRHPTRFSTTPARIGGPCPTLGQHTDEVLAELGLDRDTIASLRTAKIVS